MGVLVIFNVYNYRVRKFTDNFLPHFSASVTSALHTFLGMSSGFHDHYGNYLDLQVGSLVCVLDHLENFSPPVLEVFHTLSYSIKASGRLHVTISIFAST